MAQKATKDTYATEDIGGTEVRRQVFAGDVVPDNWNLEEGGEETDEQSSVASTEQPAEPGPVDSKSAKATPKK